MHPLHPNNHGAGYCVAGGARLLPASASSAEVNGGVLHVRSVLAAPADQHQNARIGLTPAVGLEPGEGFGEFG